MSEVWPLIKKQFDDRFNALVVQEGQLNTAKNDLDRYAHSYIATGGVSDSSTNIFYTESMAAAERIAKYKNDWATLVRDVNQKIKDISITTDIGNKLAENGRLQQEIMDLEKEEKEYGDDAKTAELRESLLRSKESDITRHQVVFLGRPLRPSSIPILWALAVLFIGASIIIFQNINPPLKPLFTTLFGTPSETGTGEGGFLSDIRVWRTLVGTFTIVIIFLSLRVANVI